MRLRRYRYRIMSKRRNHLAWPGRRRPSSDCDAWLYVDYLQLAPMIICLFGFNSCYGGLPTVVYWRRSIQDDDDDDGKTADWNFPELMSVICFRNIEF